MQEFFSEVGQAIWGYIQFTGFANVSWGNLVMIMVGLIFMYLAITKDYEPLLLVPI
ncbi:MAG TPA: sodium ion-translocating decarboxylase subunit beta, partial [Anaerolineae bacterium]|nr:sodium ion-translocating decarboxylase subunit beta [Anaerolineae bacterium]